MVLVFAIDKAAIAFIQHRGITERTINREAIHRIRNQSSGAGLGFMANEGVVIMPSEEGCQYQFFQSARHIELTNSSHCH